ncbi:hypothetical protein [Arenivirga flava]|uniref:DUF4190 domain-containing protein n=1 Tax=Arenivirga flava TaxID=1930060 RepID=A0AA37UV29_9MICO|nr:hypothetical protein [Arenivirga flava]GMA29092.1 hypothetical protein GCM10025874_23450 [Arenivirga flava]
MCAAPASGAAGDVLAPTGERTSRRAVLSVGLGLLAVAALPLSLLSAMYVTGLPPQIGIVAVPAGIAAIAAAFVARRELRRDETLTGYGLSLAGLVLGVVALGLCALQMAMPLILVLGVLVST